MDIADHPNFDAVGEFLTYLPPHPHVIPLNKLCDDMGMSVRGITSVARLARTHGYDVQIKAKGNHQYRYAAASQYGWQHIEDAALKYWAETYGVDA